MDMKYFIQNIIVLFIIISKSSLTENYTARHNYLIIFPIAIIAKNRIFSKRNYAKAKKWYYSVFLAIFRGMPLTNKMKCTLTYSQ